MIEALDRIERQLMEVARAGAHRRRRPISARTVAVVVAITLVGAAGAVAAIRTSRSSFAPGDSATYATAQRSFGVFRQGTTSPQGAALARGLVNGRAANAVDPASARLARVDGDIDMYALAGGSAVCLLQRGAVGGGGFSCSLLEDVVDGTNIMFGVADLGNGSYRLTGMAADGVRDLRIETAVGPQPLELENNVIAQVVTSKPLKVTWTAPNGSPQELDLTDGGG
jgi:hypothetical protein